MVTEERARNVRPILRWVKESAPRKREREEAASLLRLLVGVKETRQILLTRGQEELLLFIFDEFPETTTSPTQMSLWDPIEEFKMGTYSGSGKVVKVRPELPLPMQEPTVKAGLKATLTEEDQDERERVGLSRLPQPIPTSAEGVPLTERISEITESTGKAWKK